ncbi:PfkB family carbohydrate kinase [Paenibacillus tuaregi]|uniref:PfkB family carbohydrate kinase n=1 Tax=Paenibacillus tuaregi TaxID=1816681 RepID=UPI000837DB82|nr:PfkB family carbohydrate kinase [Paenibacillus tuaregi]
MRIIAVGDNVADCYLDQGLYYPGGNAVNVAVNCKRNGCQEVSYIGVFGNDKKSDHIMDSLDKEGISYRYSRRVYANSGSPGVKLVGNDRVFVRGAQDTAQHVLRLRLTPADLEYIAGHDVCHTSCYSSIERELPVIKEHCDISFDFSTRTDEDYLRQVCPYIKYAFFSGAELDSAQIEALIKTCHALGTEIVGITLGSEGALFSKNGVQYKQGVTPADVVDTMGAGDSFIAGFLVSYLKKGVMEEALQSGANSAAYTCTFYGGFGYPKPMGE